MSTVCWYNVLCLWQHSVYNTKYNRAGVEQAIKNWEGKKYRAQKFLQLPPLFQFAPAHLVGAHAPSALQLRPFMPWPSWVWKLQSYNYLQALCWPADRFVSFTEFHLGHREWSHWKVGGQRPILAPLHRNLEGHSPSLPYSLFHPCNRDVFQIQQYVCVFNYVLQANDLKQCTAQHWAVTTLTAGSRSVAATCARFCQLAQQTVHPVVIVRHQLHHIRRHDQISDEYNQSIIFLHT